MALRYQSKNAAVDVAGTAFAHGLGTTPEEWAFNHRGAPPAAASHAATLYLAAAPGTTNLTLASTSGATTADVFASVNYVQMA